ncbi:kinase-like domain-containing protein [Chaetomium tenue]|uniref:Kinase-like domain-containing protein n=1 Tax=Chaetomium tenue TaxID=1854479 RepID=A0ACB7P270_9PEZI|nr:kinase-like domain-containing protein [Chaetomium globosum]
MLPALHRLVRWQWTWVTTYLPRIWPPSRDQIAPKENIPGADFTKVGTVEPVEPVESVESVGHPSHEFPIMTEDQYKRLRKNFIESLDSTAICDLASKHNDEGKACRVVTKTSGSFNVCFFVEFDGEGPKWVVRVPIEPAFEDAWAKLQSEVATIQYLKQETRVPVPCIYAYGRDATLTKSGTGTQMFIISEFVQGHPLNKSVLKSTDDEHKETFYSQLIDVLAELRKLEFPAMGSLMPNSGGGRRPQVGPVISMSATTLRQPHNKTMVVGPVRSSLRGPFTSALEYMKYQLSLVSAFLLLPVSDHTIDDIKEEIFAFCSMEQASQGLFTSRLVEEPCVLQHLDLRSANIIVDEEFNIKGIIDWEFSGTIPRQLFAPPSWVTGHDLDEMHEEMDADFRAVLDKKRRVHARYQQLWEE